MTYPPPAFHEADRATLVAMAREIGFAAVVTPFAEGLRVTHAPIAVGDDAIELHVARSNPHAEDGATGETLAIFQGPSAYVHPGWYPSKAETGKAVPTWLYTAVHVRGPMERMDAAATRAHLDALTRAHEAGRERPWATADAPADYMARMERGIVGLRVPIRAIEGIRKLNQTKPEADFEGSRAGLAGEGSAIAPLMEAARA